MKVPPNAEDRDDQDGRACGSDAPGASATPMAGVAGVGVWALALLALPVVF